jgi:hypothetical protein
MTNLEPVHRFAGLAFFASCAEEMAATRRSMPLPREPFTSNASPG